MNLKLLLIIVFSFLLSSCIDLSAGPIAEGEKSIKNAQAESIRKEADSKSTQKAAENLARLTQVAMEATPAAAEAARRATQQGAMAAVEKSAGEGASATAGFAAGAILTGLGIGSLLYFAFVLPYRKAQEPRITEGAKITVVSQPGKQHVLVARKDTTGNMLVANLSTGEVEQYELASEVAMNADRANQLPSVAGSLARAKALQAVSDMARGAAAFLLAPGGANIDKEGK